MSVRWNEWNAQTFARAQAEDKPVLLSISAVWCHWCHVMDKGTYADERVSEAINASYIPVRVDNDRRPDINARYNQGGWPTTAFLTPDGALMAGATYMPPAQMLGALEQIAAFYRDNRASIEERAQQIREMRAQRNRQTGIAGAEAIETVMSALENAFDEEYGGFGSEPKFPMTDVLEFLLQEWLLGRGERTYDVLARTMLAMSRGGTYDHVEGGFFRYSTTRDWSIPHFEKMAEDHAALIRVLCGLVRHTKNPQFRATLVSTMGYVRDVFYDPRSHGFAGSQDADESYYALPLQERRAVKAPFVDRTSYSNWSAALAAACVSAGNVLEDEKLIAIGTDALDALDALRDERGLLYHVREPDGATAVRGLLTDQTAYVRALLDAHQETGEARFFDRALAMVDAVCAQFGAEDGGFYDHAQLEEPLGNLAFRERPIVENCALADALLRIAALTESDEQRALAERTLAVYGQSYASSGMFAAPYARALRRLLEPPTTLVLVGTAEETSALREASLHLRAPLLAMQTREPREGEQRAHGYICRGTACAPPVRSPADLHETFEAACVS